MIELKRGFHGHCIATPSPTYNSWCSLKSRCTNPKSQKWSDYGGRGIKFCERWRFFKNLLADMGACPEGQEIERIDNDKDYEPGNCRWATRKDQCRNTRANNNITFRGETLCITAWAERVGLKQATVRVRLWKGWSVEDALTTPVIHKSERHVKGQAKRGYRG